MKRDDVPATFPAAMSGVTHLMDLRVDLIRLRTQGADVDEALRVLGMMTDAYERAVASLPKMGGFRIVGDEDHAS